jgi:pyrroloquinoline quinone (PQQ) biosynthesis protein C
MEINRRAKASLPRSIKADIDHAEEALRLLLICTIRSHRAKRTSERGQHQAPQLVARLILRPSALGDSFSGH